MLAPPPLAVTSFALERVNGTRDVLAPGGNAPLCRAIFVTAIDVRIRARLSPASATRATLVATYPHHVVRRHVLRLRSRRGLTHIVLRAADERLPRGSFAAGAYRFALRASGHRATAALTLSGATTC